MTSLIEKEGRVKINHKTITRLLVPALVFILSLAAINSFAQKTVVVKIGEEPKCENVLLDSRPLAGEYTVERIWLQRKGVVDCTYNHDTGKICFTPLSVGSTEVKVYGERYESDASGKVKSRKRFERTFELRVGSAKAQPETFSPSPFPGEGTKKSF